MKLMRQEYGAGSVPRTSARDGGGVGSWAMAAVVAGGVGRERGDVVAVRGRDQRCVHRRPRHAVGAGELAVLADDPAVPDGVKFETFVAAGNRWSVSTWPAGWAVAADAQRIAYGPGRRNGSPDRSMITLC